MDDRRGAHCGGAPRQSSAGSQKQKPPTATFEMVVIPAELQTVVEALDDPYYEKAFET